MGRILLFCFCCRFYDTLVCNNAFLISSWPSDRPGLVNVAHIERMQETIIQVLRLHLLANHPDDAFLFPKLLQKLVDLRQLVTEHAQLEIGRASCRERV